jgi:hypothetical protein
VGGVVVVSAASAAPGTSNATAINRAMGTTSSPRLATDVPFLVGVGVMPTSRWWFCARPTLGPIFVGADCIRTSSS